MTLDEAIFPSEPRPTANVKGRFAPSPSGRMHLGNIYAALMSYLSARSRGGEWIVRIEDVDPQRSRREYALHIFDDLQWLGMCWDGTPEYQSDRGGIYTAYLDRLSEAGMLYPCRCTRAEIMATQAPHETDGHVVYGGTCRPDCPVEGASALQATLRLMVPPYPFAVPYGSRWSTVEFVDAFHGRQSVDLARHCGDFVVRRRDGAWAYQFVVAVDDALMGVTEVVRGDDLLLSTAVQRYVADVLALPKPQRYVHLPLLRNAEGARLSKRDQSLSMEWLRARRHPHDVIAEVCRLAGIEAGKAFEYLDS